MKRTFTRTTFVITLCMVSVCDAASNVQHFNRYIGLGLAVLFRIVDLFLFGQNNFVQLNVKYSCAHLYIVWHSPRDSMLGFSRVQWLHMSNQPAH
jgi:hypothetical protein